MEDNLNNEYSLDYLQKAAAFIGNKIVTIPKVLIICGSGLGTLAESLEDSIVIPYTDIPNFPVSTVQGHSGTLVLGNLAGIQVMCMNGRFHYYEGYSLKKLTSPIRIAKLLGVELLIVTNAAGGVNENYKIGDVMLIKDHVNFLGFAGQNPLRGLNDENFGIRFFPVNQTYDKNMRMMAKEVAKEMGLQSNVHEGVYAMVGGPNYESPSEIQALRVLKVDAVGMSTIPEVLVATHCGLKVFGFSLISNECIAEHDLDREPNHEEVLTVVNSRSNQLKEFLIKLIGRCDFLNKGSKIATSSKKIDCRCKETI